MRVLELLNVGESKRCPFYRIQHTPYSVFPVWGHMTLVPEQRALGDSCTFCLRASGHVFCAVMGWVRTGDFWALARSDIARLWTSCSGDRVQTPEPT